MVVKRRSEAAKTPDKPSAKIITDPNDLSFMATVLDDVLSTLR